LYLLQPAKIYGLSDNKNSINTIIGSRRFEYLSHCFTNHKIIAIKLSKNTHNTSTNGKT